MDPLPQRLPRVLVTRRFANQRRIVPGGQQRHLVFPLPRVSRNPFATEMMSSWQMTIHRPPACPLNV